MTADAQPGAVATCQYGNAGTYRITVAVTDGQGRTDTTTVSVQADVPPSARLTVPDKNFRAGKSAVLDASNSTDPDNTPVATYTFDCGNGRVIGPQTSPTVTCSYPGSGKFTAVVTVTDNLGQSDMASVGVHVR